MQHAPSTARRDTQPTARKLRRYHWADVVAIVTGVSALGFTIWGAPVRVDDAVSSGVSFSWLSSAAAGALALAAVLIAQYSRLPRLPARLMLAAAGALLLISPFTFLRGVPPVTLVTYTVLGLAMLVASPFIGPMPADLPPRR
jgi:hypothetical protein